MEPASRTPRDLRAAGRVRWGIVGCGDVTEVKSGPALRRTPASELVAVMRRDAAKAEDYARRHGVPRWTGDAMELIHDPEVDAVYVATPPSSHARYVHMAAAAGKPVYVEKPMALTAPEGEGMVRACEEAGVPLFVAYYRRSLPRFERVRSLLRDGAIGEPRALRAVLHAPGRAAEAETGWRWRPEVSGGGPFVDLGSHMLDLFDHWLGPIADVGAHAVSRLGREAEDGVAAWFLFEGGARGIASWDFAGALAEDEVVVTGSRGRLRVPIFADGDVVLEDAKGDVTRFDEPHPPHVQAPLLRTVVDELLGRGTCPSTGRSALRTQAVIDAILADHRLGRARRPGR